MSTKQPIWPSGRFGVPQITPFTYRDGHTHLELIEALRDYLVEHLHPSLVATVNSLVEKMEAEYGKALDQYVNGVEEFQRIHDRFMSDVNGALTALNDGAVSDLVDDPTSLLATTLGKRFVRRSDGPIYAAEFGVRGDTGEDMTEPLQRAIDAAGRVDLILPPGVILANNLQLLGYNRLIGAGKWDTRLRSEAPNTPLMVIDGQGHMFRGLEIHSRNGGHVIEQTNGVGTVSEGLLYDISFHQEHPDYSIWETNGYDFIDMRIEHFTSRHVPTATVPGWHMWTDDAGINANIWSNFRTYYSGNYHFWIESRVTNRTYGNRIEQANFELCHGGLIKIISGVAFSLDRIWNWDLQVRAPFTGHKDAISFDTNPRAGMDNIGELNHYSRVAGQLDEGVYDISIAPDKVGGMYSFSNLYGINEFGRLRIDLGTSITSIRDTAWIRVKKNYRTIDHGNHFSIREFED